MQHRRPARPSVNNRQAGWSELLRFLASISSRLLNDASVGVARVRRSCRTLLPTLEGSVPPIRAVVGIGKHAQITSTGWTSIRSVNPYRPLERARKNVDSLGHAGIPPANVFAPSQFADLTQPEILPGWVCGMAANVSRHYAVGRGHLINSQWPACPRTMERTLLRGGY